MKKKIKFLVLIIFTMVSMTGCGLSKKIYLDMNNYSKYIKVNANVYCQTLDDRVYVGSLEVADGYYALYLYKTFKGSLSLEGLSQNFNYNNVKVKVKINGNYKSYKVGDYKNPESNNFEMILEADTDIAGNSEEVNEYKNIDGNVTHDQLIKYDVEVISVSGYVTPV